MIDKTFSHPHIRKFPDNVSHFLFGRIFKSVNFFGGHSVVLVNGEIKNFSNGVCLFRVVGVLKAV